VLDTRHPDHEPSDCLPAGPTDQGTYKDEVGSSDLPAGRPLSRAMHRASPADTFLSAGTPHLVKMLARSFGSRLTDVQARAKASTTAAGKMLLKARPNGWRVSGEPSERPERSEGRRVRCTRMLGGGSESTPDSIRCAQHSAIHQVNSYPQLYRPPPCRASSRRAHARCSLKASGCSSIR